MPTTSQIRLVFFGLAFTAALGCGADEGGDDAENGSAECGVDPTSTKTSDGTSTIGGSIKLGPDLMLQEGVEAKGDLFLAVMPSFNPGGSCPGHGTPTAPVAQTLIRCVDLTLGKSIDFEIHGIPPRAEAYRLVPFLDTNGNAAVGDVAGPDTCDLISLGRDVTVAEAGKTVAADAELELDGSILMGVCGLPACMP